MKVKLTTETVREVDFEFPSFFKSIWYGDSVVYFAMYSPDNCAMLYWDGLFTQNKADKVIPTMERYECFPVSREEFREQLTKAFKNHLDKTY